jgi:protein CpxP
MSKFAIVVVVAGMFAGLSAYAQDPSQPAPAPPGSTHKQMHGDRSEQRLKRLSKKLSLTDEQKEKVRPILQDEEKQLTALNDDSTMTPQQKHQKTREIRMASKSQITDLLTPDQKEKIQSGRAHEGRRRRPADANAPAAANPPAADSKDSPQQ